jgi:hypothetical protein
VTTIRRAFGVPLNILEKIKKAIVEPWEKYGDDDGPTSDRIRKDGFWNDHIAVQSGIAVYNMPDPVTRLTRAQRERLEMLAEEASEVVKACTKILRHGYGSYNPDSSNSTANKADLEHELKDLWAVYERMADYGELSQINFYDSAETWARKLKWTHHQPEFNHPTLNKKPLKQLIEEAKEKYDAMTPEEKAAHDTAQRESFVRGMGPCEHGVYDFEDCPKCWGKWK